MVGETKVGGRLRKGAETEGVVNVRAVKAAGKRGQVQPSSEGGIDSSNSDFGEKKALQCGNISGVTIGTTIK
jgi:hypothetical protein